MSNAPQPWFAKEGLQFTCTQCGDCCTGAPGFVWVNGDEIKALAARLGLDEAEFERRYVRKVGLRKSLIEHANGDCVFLHPQTRGCTVYEDRPRQCKTWPFWDSNIKSPEAWRETCEVCPGSGTGKLYTLEQIQATAAVVKM